MFFYQILKTMYCFFFFFYVFFWSKKGQKSAAHSIAKPTDQSQDEARALNEDIFETIYFAACEASMELAELQGPYETYAGGAKQNTLLREESQPWKKKTNRLVTIQTK